MKLTDLIKIGKETISVLYPEREAGEMVFAYLEDTLGTKKHTHIVEPEYEVLPEKAEVILKDFNRMATGEPLQYVTEKAWFYGRQFHVTPDVLIPRPETEVLCNTVINRFLADRGCKVLDMCTGSGCIAWTLALEMPGAEVAAVDISDGALRVASTQDFAEEITRSGAQSPQFYKADVLEAPKELAQFDIIVSNPPYVMDKEKALMRTNVLDHEPHLALFVADDDPLLFYRAVAQWATRLLKKGGYGIVEINEALGEQTADVFRQAGFANVSVIKDLSERDRFVEFTRIN
jgi:release factor glutamine methyltransferase